MELINRTGYPLYVLNGWNCSISTNCSVFVNAPFTIGTPLHMASYSNGQWNGSQRFIIIQDAKKAIIYYQLFQVDIKITNLFGQQLTIASRAMDAIIHHGQTLQATIIELPPLDSIEINCVVASKPIQLARFNRYWRLGQDNEKVVLIFKDQELIVLSRGEKKPALAAPLPLYFDYDSSDYLFDSDSDNENWVSDTGIYDSDSDSDSDSDNG